MTDSPPRLAVVSTGIRRDLLAPLRHFSEFDLVHLYRRAEYGDLTPDDLPANLCRYDSPRDLYRQLVKARADIVQGVEPFSFGLQPYLWACYLAARHTGARLLIVTLENRPLESKFGEHPAAVLRRLVQRYARRACLIIALNAGARRNLLACGISATRIERLMWGTWGVDTDEFSPQSRPPLPASLEGGEHPATILFAGRLHPEKGIFVLLDAFTRVRAQAPEARLLIVGDGPARTEVERRVRERPQGITVKGSVKHREMPGIFRVAEVFAAPSLTTRKWEEQVGMVAIQAMACGVPVVSTRSGAIPEYVPDGVAGVLVPENDPAALAGALIRLLNDAGLRARLGRDARAYACTHYDERTNVRRAELVLKEHCLAGRV